MGIYLPNMEMPIDGNETIIRIQPDGIVLDQYGHHLAITAVPVLPHGRLIDADALIEKSKEMAEKEDGNQLDALVLLEWFFEQNAPTIIPASNV